MKYCEVIICVKNLQCCSLHEVYVVKIGEQITMIMHVVESIGGGCFQMRQLFNGVVVVCAYICLICVCGGGKVVGYIGMAWHCMLIVCLHVLTMHDIVYACLR